MDDNPLIKSDLVKKALEKAYLRIAESLFMTKCDICSTKTADGELFADHELVICKKCNERR